MMGWACSLSLFGVCARALSALHYAIASNNTVAMRVLVEAGASRDIPNAKVLRPAALPRW
jgi:hypothetical protein